MIIEFTGPPGSGKSTLESAALEYLLQNGIKAMTRIERGRECIKRTFGGKLICKLLSGPKEQKYLWKLARRYIIFNRLKFSFYNIKLSWLVITYLFHLDLSFKVKYTVLTYFFETAGFYQFFKKNLDQDEIVFLNESLVHRATSIFNSANGSDLQKYLDLLPPVDFIIWVDVPYELCSKRVEDRAEARRYLNNNRESFVKHSHEITTACMNYGQRQGWKILRVKNDVDLVSVIKNLQNQLKKELVE